VDAAAALRHRRGPTRPRPGADPRGASGGRRADRRALV